jgi:hypothetical protein
MFDGIISTARTAGAPADLTFALALLAESSSAAARSQRRPPRPAEFAQFTAETGQAFYLPSRL